MRLFVALLLIAALPIAPSRARAGVLSASACVSRALLKKFLVYRPKPKVVELLPLKEGGPSDPYDPVGLIPIGQWKGEPVDTSIKRPAQIIYEDTSKILFANFRDGHQFHLAHFPKDGVDSVYFRINRFPGPMRNVTPAHTLFYVVMKPGHEVILEAGGNAQDLSHPHPVREFVVSVDYAAPPGIGYQTFGGLTPNYLSVMDFSSAHDYALRGSDPNFGVEYLKLDLTDAQKSALVQKAIHRSQERGYRYVYDVFHYNCTTAVFELLDDVLEYPSSVKPFQIKLRKMKDAVAGPSEDALIDRGLVKKNESGQLPIVWGKYDGQLPN
jgi:hypothetical protein